MSDARTYKKLVMKSTFSQALRWDRDGRCFERFSEGPEQRRPDMDFGSPIGDLVVDPWIQDAIKEDG